MKELLFLRPPNEWFQGMPPQAKKAVRRGLSDLAAGAKGQDLKVLQGARDPVLGRLRVQNYRVVYYEGGRQLVVVQIFHRSVGYDWLE